ncbi:MAG: hypothetical protein HY897_18945 [Deltaproteobacteria bacterium]|nr:hypothetical protein [Deltaproteobacteria bacterium]
MFDSDGGCLVNGDEFTRACISFEPAEGLQHAYRTVRRWKCLTEYGFHRQTDIDKNGIPDECDKNAMGRIRKAEQQTVSTRIKYEDWTALLARCGLGPTAKLCEFGAPAGEKAMPIAQYDANVVIENDFKPGKDFVYHTCAATSCPAGNPACSWAGCPAPDSPRETCFMTKTTRAEDVSQGVCTCDQQAPESNCGDLAHCPMELGFMDTNLWRRYFNPLLSYDLSAGRPRAWYVAEYDMNPWDEQCNPPNAYPPFLLSTSMLVEDDFGGGWDFWEVPVFHERKMTASVCDPDLRKPVYFEDSGARLPVDNPIIESDWEGFKCNATRNHSQIRLGWARKGDGRYEQSSQTAWHDYGHGVKFRCYTTMPRPRVDVANIPFVYVFNPYESVVDLGDALFGGEPTQEEVSYENNAFVFMDSGGAAAADPGKVILVIDPLTQKVVTDFASRDGETVLPSALEGFSIAFGAASKATLGIGDESTQRTFVFVFGGVNRVSGHNTGDLYVGWFDDAEYVTWHRIPRTNESVVPVTKAYVAYDSVSNKFFAVGGTDENGQTFNGIAEYNFTSREWDVKNSIAVRGLERRRTASIPQDAARVFEPFQSTMFLIGGSRGVAAGPSDEVMTIWLREGTGQVDKVPAAYGPRARQAVYFDTYDHNAHLFGGIGPGGMRNDLWLFNTLSGTWEQKAGDTVAVPGTAAGSLTYYRKRNRLVYVGGDNADPLAQGKVWSLDLTRNVWTMGLRQDVTDLQPGEPVSGRFDVVVPPRVKYKTLPASGSAGELTTAVLENQSAGLTERVVDRNGTKVGAPVRNAEFEHLTFFAQPDETYTATVGIAPLYDGSAANTYELQVKKAAIGRLPGSSYRVKDVKAVDVVGDTLYAVGKSGLEIVDISNAYRPRRLSRLFMFMPAEDIKVVGRLAYIANGLFGLAVVDVSNPRRPEVLSYGLTVGYSRSVTVNGQYAFVATGVFGVQVIDISSPENVVWKDTIWVGDPIYRLASYGDTLFGHGLLLGVHLWSVADVSSPVKLSTFRTGRIGRTSILELKALVDRLFIKYDIGNEVVNVSRPDSPVSLGSLSNADVELNYVVSGLHAAKREKHLVGVYKINLQP